MVHYNKIIDNLYLGDAGFIFMDGLPKFALIINCCPEVQMSYFEGEIIRLRFNDDPNDNNKLIKMLESGNILQQIHNCINKNQPVLVHCAMGMQRSAAIVACYLLKYYNIGLDKTILYIINKRPEAFLTGNTFKPAMQYFSNK